MGTLNSANTPRCFQFTCAHFKKANEWLRQRYGDEGMIDWSLTPSKNSILASTTTTTTETTTSLTVKAQPDSADATSSSDGKAAASPSLPKAKAKDDDDFDDDDVDALEALAASEADGVPNGFAEKQVEVSVKEKVMESVVVTNGDEAEKDQEEKPEEDGRSD